MQKGLLLREKNNMDLSKMNNNDKVNALMCQLAWFSRNDVLFSDDELKIHIDRIHTTISKLQECHYFIPSLNEMNKRRFPENTKTFTVDTRTIDPAETEAYMKKITAKFKKS